MSLNKSSAISYNKGRGYSQQAITIIQFFANAKTTGQFDNQTVEAVYKVQKSPLYPFKLVADGKVGPNTLGLIIMELEHAGRMSEAAILRSYPYTIQGVAGDINPIESFSQWTSEPLILRTDKVTWYSMQGVFSVKLKLSSSLPDPTRYEYRQKIKGEAHSRLGEWKDKVWTPKPLPEGRWVNESDGFKVPADDLLGAGLYKNQWKEDGEILDGGKIERFGYRDKPPKISQGLLDFYSPTQDGHEYVLKDTFGIKPKSPYVSGAQIAVHLDYMGYVIYKEKPGTEKVVFSKQWSYNCEDILP